MNVPASLPILCLQTLEESVLVCISTSSGPPEGLVTRPSPTLTMNGTALTSPPLWRGHVKKMNKIDACAGTSSFRCPRRAQKQNFDWTRELFFHAGLSWRVIWLVWRVASGVLLRNPATLKLSSPGQKYNLSNIKKEELSGFLRWGFTVLLFFYFGRLFEHLSSCMQRRSDGRCSSLHAALQLNSEEGRGRRPRSWRPVAGS